MRLDSISCRCGDNTEIMTTCIQVIRTRSLTKMQRTEKYSEEKTKTTRGWKFTRVDNKIDG